MALPVLCTVALAASLADVAGVAAIEVPPTTIALSKLHGMSTPTEFVLAVDDASATSAKLLLDGTYIAEDRSPPIAFDVKTVSGAHRAKVRVVVRGVEIRHDADFTAGSPTTPPSTTVPSTPPTSVSPGGEVVVDSVDEIRAAFAAARPGDVIVIADGEYTFRPRLVAAPSGTATAPITIRGSRAAVLRTKNASGDYGLHVTGDHWRIEGLTVAHATKGIVLDGSVGTVIDGVEVHDIGAEAVHFRSCSSDGVLRNSYIHDTGRTSAQYGEGVYVGSANSNWSQFQCTDHLEGQPTGDNTERVLIESNIFEDITAEGADLKEGTDSGVLRDNTFRRAGTSGMNSADSAVDAKGNNWLITGNTILDTNAPWDDDGTARPSEFTDGLQTHTVYDGYGTGNVFHNNTVDGPIPGFGIGLYPRNTNTVTCDNTAPHATKGLVGDNSRPTTCQPT